MIVPGVWPGLDYKDALALGQTHLKVPVQAHPLFTLDNALELNPHVCGPKTNEFFSARFFVDGLIGLGELDLAGDLVYDFSRSSKKFFFVKMSSGGPQGSEMFSRPSPLHLPTYKGPVVAKSGNGKDDEFLLATVERKQSYLLESLAHEGIFSKVFSDPVGVNPSLSRPKFTPLWNQ